MNDTFTIYSPLLICRLCYHSLLSFHPSDCNIATQNSDHKKVSSELVLALVIGFNKNNSTTKKGSAIKLLYKSKSGVSDGHAWIGIILNIFVLAEFFSIDIFGVQERSSISPFLHTDEKSRASPTASNFYPTYP